MPIEHKAEPDGDSGLPQDAHRDSKPEVPWLMESQINDENILSQELLARVHDLL